MAKLMFLPKRRLLVAATLSAALLAACGGGGGSSAPAPLNVTAAAGDEQEHGETCGHPADHAASPSLSRAEAFSGFESGQRFGLWLGRIFSGDGGSAITRGLSRAAAEPPVSPATWRST